MQHMVEHDHIMMDIYLALPLVNVGSSPVADENLRPVEQLEVVQQEGNSDEGQGSSQNCWAWSLLDAEESYHDDLEEEHCCDDVLEDLHPQLHQHKESSEAQYVIRKYGTMLCLQRSRTTADRICSQHRRQCFWVQD